MLSWFLEQSKSYMNYGGKTCPKWKFWLRFPMAYVRFRYYMLIN